jgi:hypothetical protein
VERIGDQKSAHSSAADNDQFCRLNEDSEIAVFHEIAGHHATENDDDADDCKHG